VLAENRETGSESCESPGYMPELRAVIPALLYPRIVAYLMPMPCAASGLVNTHGLPRCRVARSTPCDGFGESTTGRGRGATVMPP
jgi:hypothetical protein